MSKLKEAFRNKKFAVTSEIGPPKGIDIEPVLVENDALKSRVEAINVTDQQSSLMRLGSLAVSKLLLERGIEPVYQLTCRDRNRLALQSDLLSAAVLGIENVLILTGDHTLLGDHPQAKPVFDLDSVQLLAAAKSLEAGKDLSGSELKGSPEFFLGSVANPMADPIEPEIIKMKKKIDSGAQFFQTQAVFDIEKFKEFMNLVKEFNVPIMAGIVLVKSEKMARYMNEKVPGVFVPEWIIDEFKKTKDKADTSLEIASSLIKGIKEYSQGVHIMPIGWNKLVVPLLERAGL